MAIHNKYKIPLIQSVPKIHPKFPYLGQKCCQNGDKSLTPGHTVPYCNTRKGIVGFEEALISFNFMLRLILFWETASLCSHFSHHLAPIFAY